MILAISIAGLLFACQLTAEAKEAIKKGVRRVAGEGLNLWKLGGHLGAISVQFEGVIAPCVSA